MQLCIPRHVNTYIHTHIPSHNLQMCTCTHTVIQHTHPPTHTNRVFFKTDTHPHCHTTYRRTLPPPPTPKKEDRRCSSIPPSKTSNKRVTYLANKHQYVSHTHAHPHMRIPTPVSTYIHPYTDPAHYLTFRKYSR